MSSRSCCNDESAGDDHVLSLRSGEGHGGSSLFLARPGVNEDVQVLVTAEGANTSITNAYCGCKDGNGGGQLRRFKDMPAPILIGIIFINSYICC